MTPVEPLAHALCVHGHFYQPPREDPWLEVIEPEPSAAPHRDWNRRIHHECYRANTAARISGDTGEVLDIANNYEHISFNFGPTLLRWLEAHDPWTYQRILAADRASQKRLGHGNAIAQVYNHVILPLASDRDQATQVRWGIQDFEHRFGRAPAGMWLAETAADRVSLRVLADEGITYTILSPHQAVRYRRCGATRWADVDSGDIPSGRPYLYDVGGGKRIVLFFYDPGLANGIAFGGLLGHSERLLAQVDARFREQTEPSWLVHWATDGESYGHHARFGDMALAAALRKLKQRPNVELTNYAAFLASSAPEYEVEIASPSSWSCAHGVGRWSRDCGCSAGRDNGRGDPWNQSWRAPLRAALDGVRAELDTHFERVAGELVRDPWALRDAYVTVLLEPALRDELLHEHLNERGRTLAKTGTVLELLEMQRCAMLMYTSCGWFFDEISDLETVLIQKFAARAMELAGLTGSVPLEPVFRELMARAPSNLPEFKNGAEVFDRLVRPITPARVAANVAMRQLARQETAGQQLFVYDAAPKKTTILSTRPVGCVTGQLDLRDRRTDRRTQLSFAAVHFGGLDFRCAVEPLGSDDLMGITQHLQRALTLGGTQALARTMGELFGQTNFDAEDLFGDVARELTLAASHEPMRLYRDLQRHFFQAHHPLLRAAQRNKLPLPADIGSSIGRVLAHEITDLVRDWLNAQGPLHSGRSPRPPLDSLRAVLSEAAEWGVEPQCDTALRHIGAAIEEMLLALSKTESLNVRELGERLAHLAAMGCLIPGVLERWMLQTVYHEIWISAQTSPEIAQLFRTHPSLEGHLNGLLGCRFASRGPHTAASDDQ